MQSKWKLKRKQQRKNRALFQFEKRIGIGAATVEQKNSVLKSERAPELLFASFGFRPKLFFDLTFKSE